MDGFSSGPQTACCVSRTGAHRVTHLRIYRLAVDCMISASETASGNMQLNHGAESFIISLGNGVCAVYEEDGIYSVYAVHMLWP